MFEKKVRGDQELSRLIGENDKSGDKFEFFQSLTAGASELDASNFVLVTPDNLKEVMT